MAFASVSLLAACVLGVFALSYGLPYSVIQQSESEKAASQASSYNQESYTSIDNPIGPDYVSYENNSGSSSSSSYEYENNNNYLNTDGLYSTGIKGINGISSIQQEQQMEAEYAASHVSSDLTTLGGTTIAQSQAESEYAYNQQQSSLNQIVSY